MNTMEQEVVKPRILVGCTGSVATIKLAVLCRLLLEFAEVKVAATTSSRHFVNEAELPEQVKPLLGDEEEWRSWQAVGDPVLHIELRRWADLLLIAPLSANSLAKVANGLCDNLLTCVVRAWEFSKPLVVAPAMNTAMWQSPFTAKHLGVLQELGAHVVGPISKKLACGDVGHGAMATPEDIVARCRELLLVPERPHACTLEEHGTSAPPAGAASVAADVALGKASAAAGTEDQACSR